jgi:serine/threonine protein kinase
LKVIRPDLVTDPGKYGELASRFKREARITARIEHPNVPAVYDAAVDVDQGRLYLIMQLVRGVSLADVIAEEKPMTVAAAVSVAAQICSALSHAHAVPVVHRDLKPGNVMIADDGMVKVLDFGIAAVLRTDMTRITMTGSQLGTCAYMPPEQVLTGGVNPRSDLYSLGCVMYEALTGEPVFSADYTPFQLQRAHVEEEPKPPSLHRPDLPADLDQLVADLLAKDSEARPASVQEVYDRLATHLPQPAPSAGPKPRRVWRPNPGRVGPPAGSRGSDLQRCWSARPGAHCFWTRKRASSAFAWSWAKGTANRSVQKEPVRSSDAGRSGIPVFAFAVPRRTWLSGGNGGANPWGDPAAGQGSCPADRGHRSRSGASPVTRRSSYSDVRRSAPWAGPGGAGTPTNRSCSPNATGYGASEPWTPPCGSSRSYALCPRCRFSVLTGAACRGPGAGASGRLPPGVRVRTTGAGRPPEPPSTRAPPGLGGRTAAAGWSVSTGGRGASPNRCVPAVCRVSR